MSKSKKPEGAISFIYMAGDIGGTNARLQLIERRISPNRNAAGEPQILPALPELNKWYGPDADGCDERLLAREEYKSSEFLKYEGQGLLKILDTFLKAYPSYAPKACTLGMAGPIDNEQHSGKITQHDWTLSAREVSQKWNIPQVKLVNDFVAAGYGLLGLTSDATESLTPNLHRDRKAPIACLGAGTGLGEVYLIHNGTEYEAWPTEGGHTSFAARSMLEFELREYCKQAINASTVSVERLVSGMFFPHTYWFFAKKFPQLENKEVSNSIRNAEANAALPPEERNKSIPPPSRIITVHALKKTDELCVRAQDMFVALYGAEAGDLALKTLPFGGLYVAGGTTNKVLETIKEDNKFMNNFREKGRLKAVVSRIPVYIVKEPSCDNLGLLGSRVLCRRILRTTISKEAMIRSKM